MKYDKLKTNELGLKIFRASLATIALIACSVIYADYSQASGFNVTSPVAPPVVGQRPITDAGLRSTWLGYFAPPAWMQRGGPANGSGSDRRDQRNPMYPGMGR